MKRVVIVGAQGQDGRLLHERLERDGDTVVAVRREDRVLDDQIRIRAIVELQVDEIYYLAAHHHSSQESRGLSDSVLFSESVKVHMNGIVNFLEAIRECSPRTRIFYAASCLIYGNPSIHPQDEETPFDPRCVYGITKSAGIRICRYYREQFGLFASGGILYNHESPIRDEKFVIPKIIKAAYAIKAGSQEKLVLGDLSARVDWGYAVDYVDAMIRVLRSPEAEDFVIATGEMHSVEEVVEFVFKQLGLRWQNHVEEAPEILGRKRNALCGDSRKLRRITGWRPTVGFLDLLKILVSSAGRP
jgi:GDPmannose 4,6-dehydratase